MRLKINEAIARSEAKGKKVKKKDLAALLWPTSRAETQVANFVRLCAGKTQCVRPEWVMTISAACDCTPNYLYGVSE